LTQVAVIASAFHTPLWKGGFRDDAVAWG